MRFAKSFFLTLFIFILLSLSDVSASSKSGLEGHTDIDLSFFLKKEKKENDPNIYLYSSLSLLTLDPGKISFYLSKYPEKRLIPISSMEVFVPFEPSVQSEYFDFTIWGQLGSYFNKDIEIIELENEILYLFKELESLNRRYRSIFNAAGFKEIDTNILTLNRTNYFDFSPQRRNAVVSVKETRRDVKGRHRLRMIEKEDILRSGERIKDELLKKKEVPVGQKRNKIVKQGEMRARGEFKKRLRFKEPDKHPIIDRIFEFLGKTFNYFFNHKIEFFIYMFLFILCVKFILLIIIG